MRGLCGESDPDRRFPLRSISRFEVAAIYVSDLVRRDTEPYRSLLVHTVHMTVTVEEFYGGSVDVRVLETVHRGSEYTRKILLVLRDSGRVVQFGLVQIDLDLLGENVRAEILAGQTPLGRVLIENEVLRDIQPAGYLKVELDGELTRQFGLVSSTTTYGRLGVISTDGRPAIEVLEILAPVPTG